MLRDAAAVAQQLEVPRAVHRVAVQHAADELVVADHELLVHAAGGIGQHDLLGVLAAREIARGEEVDAGHLELGRHLRSRVAPDAVAREMVRAHLRHLEQRRHEAVRRAAMRDALADRVDARIERLHRVVDDDAAVAVQAGGLRERDVGADADRHHDEIRRQLLAASELAPGDAAATRLDQRFRLRFEAEARPFASSAFLQHVAQPCGRAAAP